MLTHEQARQIAFQWIDAWNAHDLERILEHYAPEIVFSSPFLQLMSYPNGTLEGIAELRTYFAAALERFPTLEFVLRGVFVGTETLTLLYDSVNGLNAAETMEINGEDKVVRVWAQYDMAVSR